MFECQSNYCKRSQNGAVIDDMNAESAIPRSIIKYFLRLSCCIVSHFREPNGSTESESTTRFISDA